MKESIKFSLQINQTTCFNFKHLKLLEDDGTSTCSMEAVKSCKAMSKPFRCEAQDQEVNSAHFCWSINCYLNFLITQQFNKCQAWSVWIRKLTLLNTFHIMACLKYLEAKRHGTTTYEPETKKQTVRKQLLAMGFAIGMFSELDRNMEKRNVCLVSVMDMNNEKKTQQLLACSLISVVTTR